MAEHLVDPLLITVLVLNFRALSISRVRLAIQVVALQGIFVSLLPLLTNQGTLELREIGLVVVTVTLKGFLIPALLFRAIRELDIRREMRPFIDYVTSLLLGALGTALALVFATTLPLHDQHVHSMQVPAALSTAWAGFLLLSGRRKAVLQVLGYLVLENGIFIFGMLLLEAMPFLVEVGVLLDLFTGVFVMGILINHINREFAADDPERLSELKE